MTRRISSFAVLLAIPACRADLPVADLGGGTDGATTAAQTTSTDGTSGGGPVGSSTGGGLDDTASGSSGESGTTDASADTSSVGTESETGEPIDCGEPDDYPGQLCFGLLEPSMVAAGLGPQYLVAADADGDGVPDLVTLETDSRNVVSYRGAGSGELWPGVGHESDPNVDIFQSAFINGMAAGDFNGDDVPDVVFGYQYPLPPMLQGLRVAHGDGSGGFTLAYDTIADSGSLHIRPADIDGDGDLDVLADSLSGGLGIQRNDDGMLQDATLVPLDATARDLNVVDLDGDGALDIVASSSVGVSVLLGVGDGTFGAATVLDTPEEPSALAAGDFDGDTTVDIVAYVHEANAIAVFSGDGDGGFAAAVSHLIDIAAPVAVHEIEVGDVDHDGLPDLVLSRLDGDSLTILRGNGAGGFQAASDWQVGASPTDVVLSDLNGDGALDVAATVREDNRIAILMYDPCHCF